MIPRYQNYTSRYFHDSPSTSSPVSGPPKFNNRTPTLSVGGGVRVVKEEEPPSSIVTADTDRAVLLLLLLSIPLLSSPGILLRHRLSCCWGNRTSRPGVVILGSGVGATHAAAAAAAEQASSISIIPQSQIMRLPPATVDAAGRTETDILQSTLRLGGWVWFDRLEVAAMGANCARNKYQHFLCTAAVAAAI